MKLSTSDPNSVFGVTLKLSWILLKLVLIAFAAATVENPGMFVYAGF
jgi:hypothetical protein